MGLGADQRIALVVAHQHRVLGESQIAVGHRDADLRHRLRQRRFGGVVKMFLRKFTPLLF
jgi:hypothetical protein